MHTDNEILWVKFICKIERANHHYTIYAHTYIHTGTTLLTIGQCLHFPNLPTVYNYSCSLSLGLMEIMIFEKNT